jgi:asparagine synthase (glutamine-hydrolysing)
MLAAALRLLPHACSERDLVARARRFARFAHVPLAERAARWNSLFPDGTAELLQPDVIGPAAAADPLAHVRLQLEAAAGASPLGQLLAANFASYLPDDLLVKTDRCTMAHSLEARSPLLDTALAEYAASLPDEFKLTRTRTKAILRDAFADLIPPDIGKRPKTGFGVPLDRWFRTELRDYVRDLLLPRSAAIATYVRPDAMSRLVDDHLAGRINAGHRLWALVCFERWLRILPEWRARQLSPQ